MTLVDEYKAALGNIASAQTFLELIGKQGHCIGKLTFITVDATIHWQERAGSKNYFELKDVSPSLRSALAEVIKRHFKDLAQEALVQLKSTAENKKQAAKDEYNRLFNEVLNDSSN